MDFELLILGTSSARPAHGRFPSCYALDLEDRTYLFDCGEGAQIRFYEWGVQPSRLHQIFISHLHGDHFFGLPGLLTSMALSGRTQPLQIYGPPGLEDLILPLVARGDTGLPFLLEFFPVPPDREGIPVFSDDKVEVFSFPVQHRVPTTGFFVREHPHELNIKSEVIEKYKLSVPQIKAIKRGEDLRLEADGKVVPNQELTQPRYRSRTFAYCTDTRINWKVPSWLEGVDLLFHETTFCEEFAQRAEETGHSTAAQAAELARRIGAGRLITGHYSSRYKKLDAFAEEAGAIFPATWLGVEGGRYRVGRSREGAERQFERQLPGDSLR